MTIKQRRATQPAVQGEPVGWQFYQDGKWWNGDDRIKDHRKNTEEAGMPVRDVYASPQPTEPDEERLAMEAVMESINPATWPGLTTAQRCALGRFAKPQPTEQQPISHDWDDQDKCRRCGDRDWYASATCTPKPKTAPDVDVLVEALEELIDLMEDVRQGEYTPDSFTTQPARIALAAYRK